MKNNPLRLAENRVLAEQLRLVMENVVSSVIPAILVAILLLWTLSNNANSPALEIWCGATILSKLASYFHARHHLATSISFAQTRRLAWELAILNMVDAALWGSLAWVTLDSSTMAGSILVVAVLTGIAASSLSSLSPVMHIFIVFLSSGMAVSVPKLLLMNDPAFHALGGAALMLMMSLIWQARNSSIAARVAIDLRFELADSHERLREIELRQTLAQERQRMCQDMHDGLGSSLVSALRVVEHGHMDEAEVALVLKGCIDDLKLAIDSMEPVDADLLLLLATLRYRLEPRLANTGIVLRWEIKDVSALVWLNPKNALHILRILQETFTNIIKHTQATEIRVATDMKNEFVVVMITDNGHGFSVESALGKGGKGLSNQLRRAEAIGAKVSWESNDCGTCFTLLLPTRQQPATP